MLVPLQFIEGDNKRYRKELLENLNYVQLEFISPIDATNDGNFIMPSIEHGHYTPTPSRMPYFLLLQRVGNVDGEKPENERFRERAFFDSAEEMPHG